MFSNIFYCLFKENNYELLVGIVQIKFNRFNSDNKAYSNLWWFMVIVIVWRLRGNIIRTTPCWVVWHNVHSQQHTHASSSYRCRLGLSHWDPYAMHRGGCLKLYYCNMVEWSWWDSGLIWKTNWLPSVLWHCWFGHMTCKNRPRYDL